ALFSQAISVERWRRFVAPRRSSRNVQEGSPWPPPLRSPAVPFAVPAPFPRPSEGRSPSTIVEQVDEPGLPGAKWERIRNMEPGLVAVLLDAGADPNAQDSSGLTPLTYAAGQRRIELLRLLPARGAKVDFKAPNGMKASDLAIGAEVVRALREAQGRQ